MGCSGMAPSLPSSPLLTSRVLKANAPAFTTSGGSLVQDVPKVEGHKKAAASPVPTPAPPLQPPQPRSPGQESAAPSEAPPTAAVSYTPVTPQLSFAPNKKAISPLCEQGAQAPASIQTSPHAVAPVSCLSPRPPPRSPATGSVGPCLATASRMNSLQADLFPHNENTQNTQPAPNTQNSQSAQSLRS